MLRSDFENILEAERVFLLTTRRQHHNITTAIHNTALSSIMTTGLGRPTGVHLIVCSDSSSDALMRQRFETPSAVPLAKSMLSTQVHTISYSGSPKGEKYRLAVAQRTQFRATVMPHHLLPSEVSRHTAYRVSVGKTIHSLPGFESNSQYARNTPSTEDNFISP